MASSFIDGSVLTLQASTRFLKSSSIRAGRKKGIAISQSHFLGKTLTTDSGCRKSDVKKDKGKTVTAAQALESGGDNGFMAVFNNFVDGFLKKLRGEPEEQIVVETEIPVGNTVLVAGATGKTGRLIVKKLLERNNRVVALVSSEEKANEILVKEVGLTFGRNQGGGELVTVVGDLTESETVKAAVKGVDAVICAVGTRYSPAGFLENGSPQEVYGEGISNLIQAAVMNFEEEEESKDDSVVIFDFSGPPTQREEGPANGASSATGGGKRGVLSAVPGWYILDDVIMGGISDGGLVPEDGKAVFKGTLRAEGGGFSSVRTQLEGAPLDLSGRDGIRIRVKGDGQRYKLGLRTQAEFQGPPFVAMFNTLRGKWTDVAIPFDRFKAADQSNLIAGAEPLDPSRIHAVQILASLFQFNKQPNPLATPGPFRLELAWGKAYRAPRPRFVLVSSAAVERSARVQTPQERGSSIPIVRLNPGGVLTWKFEAEERLRASGLPYAVVRPCGLTEKDLDSTFQLEVAQGDAITGLISREEAASVAVEALESPEATNTTFEVRRDELTKGLETRNFRSLFGRLRPDVFTGNVAIISPAATEPLPAPANPVTPAQPQDLGVKVSSGEQRKEGKGELVLTGSD